MSVHLLPRHPFLHRETGFTPLELCHDIFTLYYHEYTDVLDRLKKLLTDDTHAVHLLTRGAINFAYNQIAPWVNKHKLPTDKSPIAHRFPITLENVCWLLLTSELCELVSRDFANKHLVPLLLDRPEPAYDIPEVNRAIADHLAENASASDLDTTLLTIIHAYPDKLAEFKGGKANLANFFIGAAIKETGNKSPALRAKVTEILSTL